jgi:hypothetical protein
MNQPLLAVFSMQKNEALLAHNWLKYYSGITSPSSIYVIDNGSSEESAKIYCSMQNTGLNLRRQEGKKYFEDKGNVLLDWAREEHKRKNFDFIYFADADEFLFASNHGDISSSKQVICDELRRLSRSKNNIFRIKYGFVNIPETTLASPDYYGSQKIVLGASALEIADMQMDLGFHLYDWGNLEDSSTYGYIEHTNLGYIHLHNKPYDLFREHALEKLSGRVDLNDMQTLRNYKGAGMHLIRRLLMDKAEYDQSFRRTKNTIDIEHLFREHAMKHPIDL